MITNKMITRTKLMQVGYAASCPVHDGCIVSDIGVKNLRPEGLRYSCLLF